jgi:hypothetical protein
VRPSLPSELILLILRCLLNYSVRTNRIKEKGNALIRRRSAVVTW